MLTGSLSRLVLAAAGVAVYPPGSTFGPRTLRDFEFVWIIEGDAAVYLGEQRIDAPTGTILLARPGMTDRYEWSGKRASVHAYFHFDARPLPRTWPGANAWPLSRRVTESDILRPLFRYVLHVYSLEPAMRSTLAASCIEAMLKSFITGRFHIASEPYAQLPAPVERALTFIRHVALREPAPAIALADLAHAAHVTPEHLCRLFRQSLNLGPLECVRLARLERAATLLARSNLAIKQITEATGFASPYHFSRKFREVYQLSPREYRRALRDGKPVRTNPISSALLIKLFSGGR